MTKQELEKLAQENLEMAYVPYSHFPVSAVLVTDDNQVFTGINIENSSYGLSNCAERTAIFKAVSEGHLHFKHLFIAGHTDEPISPCGACRQVMAEFFAPEMPITLLSDSGETKETNLSELLPYSFTEKQM
ncbi:cytidine deaminase [Enterococcus timonensis]|uniref:cytidine deaminase n=1 Tax=Enterococcus timonensis TaxID=1852364 RepID=UPI0008D99588|nr:cytidine deaminase [Enterococcus timonensis]